MQRTYRIGYTVVGVRTSSRRFGEWLDAVLGRYAVEDEADPYYSVLVAEEERAPVGRPFHILYEESRALVRSHRLREVAEALLFELEGALARERRDAVYLGAGIVSDDAGTTALVPALVVPYLATLGSRVERAGIRLPRQRVVAVEVGSGDIVPLRPALDVPAEALDALGPPAGGATAVDAVDVVCSIGLAEEPVSPVSPAEAVYRLAYHALNLDMVGSEALAALAAMVEDARCVEIRSASTRETLAALRAAMHAG